MAPGLFRFGPERRWMNMSTFEMCADGQRALILTGLFLVMVMLLFLVIYQISQRDSGSKFWYDVVIFLLLFVANIIFGAHNQMAEEGNTGSGIGKIIPIVLGVVGVGYGVIRLIWLHGHRGETLSRDAIREGFDNLPMGVAFFDQTGFPRMINRRMHILGMYMAGKEIQSRQELVEALAAPGQKIQVISREPAVYAFPDGSVWKYSQRTVTTESREVFTQFLAVDVTALSVSRQKLEQENEQLRETGRLIRELSSNVVSITREEEVLAMKVKVHDELGYNVLAAHRALTQEKLPEDMEELIRHWEKTLLLMNAEQDVEREETTGREQKSFSAEAWTNVLKERAAMLGLTIRWEGSFPEEERAAELVRAAVLECMTNSVRHGRATRLEVCLRQEPGWYQVMVCNNGSLPEKPITEGGGLSGLRTRIQQEGGTMEVREKPAFLLIIRIPKEDER